LLGKREALTAFFVSQVTTSVLQKLLAALNECTEWGQVNLFILFSMAGKEETGGARSETSVPS
jgi:hypothetical protein